jgi:hypothetical protein
MFDRAQLIVLLKDIDRSVSGSEWFANTDAAAYPIFTAGSDDDSDWHISCAMPYTNGSDGSATDDCVGIAALRNLLPVIIRELEATDTNGRLLEEAR